MQAGGTTISWGLQDYVRQFHSSQWLWILPQYPRVAGMDRTHHATNKRSRKHWKSVVSCRDKLVEGEQTRADEANQELPQSPKGVLSQPGWRKQKPKGSIKRGWKKTDRSTLLETGTMAAEGSCFEPQRQEQKEEYRPTEMWKAKPGVQIPKLPPANLL